MLYIEQEVIRDYEVADSMPNMATKKMLASKYNASSNKANDIKNAILIYMRELRKSKTEFTKEDAKWFNRLASIEMYKKAVEWFNEESRSFVSFLAEHYMEQLKKHKLDNKLYMVNERYGISASQKYLLKLYINTDRYLKEHTEEAISKKRSDEEIIKNLFNVLTENMVAFHEQYIEHVKNSAIIRYNKMHNDDYLASLKAKMDEIHEIAMKQKPIERKHTIDRYNEYAKRYNAVKSFRKMYATPQQHIDKCVADAEDIYKNNVMSIADRLKDKDFVAQNIKVENVGDDAKFFSMYISDNNKKVYCRSVLAAEYSDKMVPHFRFIITDRH